MAGPTTQNNATPERQTSFAEIGRCVSAAIAERKPEPGAKPLRVPEDQTVEKPFREAVQSGIDALPQPIRKHLEATNFKMYALDPDPYQVERSPHKERLPQGRLSSDGYYIPARWGMRSAGSELEEARVGGHYAVILTGIRRNDAPNAYDLNQHPKECAAHEAGHAVDALLGEELGKVMGRDKRICPDIKDGRWKVEATLQQEGISSLPGFRRAYEEDVRQLNLHKIERKDKPLIDHCLGERGCAEAFAEAFKHRVFPSSDTAGGIFVRSFPRVTAAVHDLINGSYGLRAKDTSVGLSSLVLPKTTAR